VVNPHRRYSALDYESPISYEKKHRPEAYDNNTPPESQRLQLVEPGSLYRWHSLRGSRGGEAAPLRFGLAASVPWVAAGCGREGVGAPEGDGG
jgi:hypothetical protein